MTGTATMVSLQRVRVVLARTQQLIGWAGITGVALLVAASIVAALAWSTHKAFREAQAARPAVARELALPIAPHDTTAAVTPELPPASEIPLLLTQLKYAAAGNGLEWRAADYRIIAATPTQPASLEVRCSLKGPYPKLRGMLVQLMRAIPTFTIREFAASRPNADIAEVETKLVLAVFLGDGATASDTPSKAVP